MKSIFNIKTLTELLSLPNSIKPYSLKELEQRHKFIIMYGIGNKNGGMTMGPTPSLIDMLNTHPDTNDTIFAFIENDSESMNIPLYEFNDGKWILQQDEVVQLIHTGQIDINSHSAEWNKNGMFYKIKPYIYSKELNKHFYSSVVVHCSNDKNQLGPIVFHTQKLDSLIAFINLTK